MQNRNAAVASSIQRDLQRFVLYPDAFLRAGSGGVGGVTSPSAGSSSTAATMGAASLGGGKGEVKASDDRKAASLVSGSRTGRSVTLSPGGLKGPFFFFFFFFFFFGAPGAGFFFFFGFVFLKT